MMIIGCEIISSNEKNPDESIFKLTLLPLTTIKKVTRIESLMGGAIEDIIGGMAEHQAGQLKDTMYITLGEWRDQSYKIARHVSLEILPDNTTGGVDAK